MKWGIKSLPAFSKDNSDKSFSPSDNKVNCGSYAFKLSSKLSLSSFVYHLDRKPSILFTLIIG